MYCHSICQHVQPHDIIQLSDHVKWGREYVSKMLELYLMEAYLNITNLISSCENIITKYY